MNLAPPHLKVTADEPGRLLVLEHEKIVLPAMARGLVGGLLRAAGAAESEDWWRPRRIRVDREAGVLAIDDVQVLRDEERSESIELARLAAVTVRTRHVPPSGNAAASPYGPGNPRHVDAIVHVRGGASERSLRLQVEGMDTLEKVADFALRLGSVMGLRYQRVVVSDPRRLEIQMAAGDGPGLAPIAPASEAARIIAEQHMPPLDVPRFPSENPVSRWAPGDEVRFDKPFDARMALGCLPVAIGCLLLGPAMWFLYHDVMGTVIGTALGLLFGGLAVGMVVMSLPRHARIAWGPRAITVGGLLRRRRVPFDRIDALELRCLRRYESHGSRGQYTYHSYRCRLNALVRGDATKAATPLELVSTKSFKSEPEAPYDAALPLTKALAEALGVEWTVTDYN